METPIILPAITLYQPWASWIMRGWKTIETRTHDRFKSLNGKRIVIHAGKTTDRSTLVLENGYLSQVQKNASVNLINGFVLGTARVCDYRELDISHSAKSLIDCNLIKRYGLFLTDIQIFTEPIRCDGSMGIWYFDIANRVKVKKSDMSNKQLNMYA